MSARRSLGGHDVSLAFSLDPVKLEAAAREIGGADRRAVRRSRDCGRGLQGMGAAIWLSLLHAD